MILTMQLPTPYDDLLIGARFVAHLPGYLRRPLTVEQAGAILRDRLKCREANFLTLLRRAVYGNATSPYRELLRLAGCEYGDFEGLVNREGLAGALAVVQRRGVYLSLDEFKGRQPAVRGSATLPIDPHCLRNPAASVHLLSQSGGSGGTRTTVPIDFPTIRERAVNTCLTLAARGGQAWIKAHWGVPGGSFTTVLRFSGFGDRVARWFSQVDLNSPGLHPRYRWSARLMSWASAMAGVPLPGPEFVPLDDPLPIARWLADVLRTGATPHLHTFASPAVRLCQAAAEAGLDLSGAQLTTVGEPTTAARLAAIRRVGAVAVPDYGSSETGGFIAYGCLAPEAPDDVHLCQDLHELIPPEAGLAELGLPPTALLISSLRPTAPIVLLNVSLGDQAEMATRRCGCPLERLGWTTHLQAVRSFDKLSAGGMTFLDADAARALEEALPARFGGGPTDYQLVEDEADDGQARLRLLVHPRLGPLDAAAVAAAFLDAIGEGSGAQRVMALQWRQAGFPRVERRAPFTTAAGKIVHLHREPRRALSPAVRT